MSCMALLSFILKNKLKMIYLDQKKSWHSKKSGDLSFEVKIY